MDSKSPMLVLLLMFWLKKRFEIGMYFIPESMRLLSLYPRKRYFEREHIIFRYGRNTLNARMMLCHIRLDYRLAHLCILTCYPVEFLALANVDALLACRHTFTSASIHLATNARAACAQAC